MDPPSGSDPSALPSPGSSQQETRDPLRMGGGLGHLPEDILLEIFAWVPCKDLILSCRLVCLQWRDLADSTVLWKRKFEGWKKIQIGWKRLPGQPSPQPDDFYILGRLERNLIKNPCGEEGMDFWEIGTPSEGQWEIQTISEEEIERHWLNADLANNKCFSASNGLCIKSQRITLKDHGYWEDLMDTASLDIVVKDILYSTSNSYQLTVKLLSADNQVLQEYCTQGKINPWAYGIWREVSYTFYGCPPGVRHILFQHQGGVTDGSDPKHYTKVTRSSILVSRRGYEDNDFDYDDYYDVHDCYNSSDEYYGDSDSGYFFGYYEPDDNGWW